jgi:hypothetical protein
MKDVLKYLAILIWFYKMPKELKQIYFSNPEVEQNNAILDELELCWCHHQWFYPVVIIRTSNRGFKS